MKERTRTPSGAGPSDEAPSGEAPDSKRHRARRGVVQALYQWQLTSQDVGEIAEQFRGGELLGGADLDYFDTAFAGVTTHRQRLEQALDPFLERASSELDPVERAVLWLGAWELLDRDEIPSPVVINEAVELAKAFGGTDGHSFVNAVLDAAARAWGRDAPRGP
jgi:N utilization substance protein B